MDRLLDLPLNAARLHQEERAPLFSAGKSQRKDRTEPVTSIPLLVLAYQPDILAPRQLERSGLSIRYINSEHTTQGIQRHRHQLSD